MRAKGGGERMVARGEGGDGGGIKKKGTATQLISIKSSISENIIMVFKEFSLRVNGFRTPMMLRRRL